MNHATQRPDPSAGRPKIWIDLDNSPHVPFFAPIVAELRQRGFPLLLTARDCFQVCELAVLHNLSCRTVGRHYGKHLLLKLFGLGVRALQLAPLVLREKPTLAISHGSRSQLLLSKILGIKTLRICDYEFAVNPPLLRATWDLVPEVIPAEAVGRNDQKTLTYPGIKEDVYVPGFKPDPSLRGELGVSDSDVVVTVRPPAVEAHYRSRKSDQLYAAVMVFLLGHPSVRIVLVPRSEKQGREARGMWPDQFASGRILIPQRVVDGLNLIWNSDLVISGGGTMNREAAALRVPVYSIFGGQIGAVDRYLAAQGRVVLLQAPEEIQRKVVLTSRIRDSYSQCPPRAALEAIVSAIESLADASLGRGSAGSPRAAAVRSSRAR